MIRALVTLVGLVGAAILLYLAPRADDSLGHGIWAVAGAWVAAGLVVGILYQAGGVRRAGLRVNLPLLLLAWLPWTALTVGLVAQRRDPGLNVARWLRDVVPDGWVFRWLEALPAFAFGSGLLLAFALIEPRVAEIVREYREDRDVDVPVAPAAPVAPATVGGTSEQVPDETEATVVRPVRDRDVEERPRVGEETTVIDRDVDRAAPLGEGETTAAGDRDVDRPTTPGSRPGGLSGSGDETVVIRPSGDDAVRDLRGPDRR